MSQYSYTGKWYVILKACAFFLIVLLFCLELCYGSQGYVEKGGMVALCSCYFHRREKTIKNKSSSPENVKQHDSWMWCLTWSVVVWSYTPPSCIVYSCSLSVWFLLAELFDFFRKQIWCGFIFFFFQSDEEGGKEKEGEDGQQKFIAHVPVPSQQEVRHQKTGLQRCAPSVILFCSCLVLLQMLWNWREIRHHCYIHLHQRIAKSVINIE